MLTLETGMKFITMLAIALTLVACGSDNSEEVVEAEPTVGKEIADDYNRALDQARAVEEQAMEQKRKIDEALEQAEGN
jgi:hypothetical protein